MGRRRAKKIKWPKPPKGHRRPPYRHSVRAHKREGYPVHSYVRGQGDPRPHKSISRLKPVRQKVIKWSTVSYLHSKRTPTARKVDENLRAPITEDYKLWVGAPNEYDVTGVDSAGGYSKASEIDETQYTHAKLNMNQIGGIYRVDVWDKKGDVEAEKFGFKSKEEAQKFIQKINEANKPKKKEGTEATYNVATGWLQIHFDEKPDREILNQLKAEGFSYRPSTKVWKAKQTSSREALLKKMAGEVEEVKIEISHSKRAERYQYLADKYKAERDELWDKHDRIAKMIPMGQPILVGHHSEKRHRRDIERMRSYTNKSIEATEKYEKYQRLANKARGTVEHGENPVTIHNRIKKLEKQEGNLILSLTEKQRDKKYDIENKKTLQRVKERLEIERRKYKEVGGIPSESMDLKPGDRIKTRFGEATVKKVSKKSIRADMHAQGLQRSANYRDYKLDKTDILGYAKNNQ